MYTRDLIADAFLDLFVADVQEVAESFRVHNFVLTPTRSIALNTYHPRGNNYRFDVVQINIKL